jgi:hypothetical protein
VFAICVASLLDIAASIFKEHAKHSTYVADFPYGLAANQDGSIKRQEWRKSSNHGQAPSCSVNYNSKCLQ